ncbi:hypothetical protein [Nocardia thailandica]|uniref:hypothetical protein n=1 Tax=Nocardia thailandica TaxID=257275 RepID=UPI0002DD4B47|nr:hypothetical protein [Nocardia thailandica]
MIIHCPGMFWWCLADNIAHSVLRVPLDQDLCDDADDWPDVPDHWGYRICRRHDAALERAARRELYGDRARRIRQLGWGQ